ncbi:MAG: 50S ribosomal protein L11 methyltransferase [Flavobacteriaceae bacterium]|nr:50S ribosomal protein L11 methyltransferase [Flavobacteriaceae bacterium]
MIFIEYNFTVTPPVPWSEILLAKLSQIEFDSFEENETGFKGYILSDNDDEEFINFQISELEEAQISYEKKEIPQINWNEEWEKNFSPIEVDQRCFIRADFHEPNPDFLYEIIIQPKMSFGTGHHETTRLMVEFILDNDFEGKSVLDMGTGTGILAILTKLKGADHVVGIDIDEWSYHNARENAERNNTQIEWIKGGAESIPQEKYDCIIANINKNILMEDMPFYTNALKTGGTLLLSGLYDFDSEDIIQKANEFGLKFDDMKSMNQWIALKFTYE